ncbi:hypothetical protein DUI87_17879 [Hirundo rustica rustica]|uniref:Uncharacterized protein n=1 Tax=Hirundo rustica rustica TaxID=333673 RepID=A0A3M0JV58_HIRRU|nr:hypothetical protein DUI87_17879 [Hirundo rustica rustica]
MPYPRATPAQPDQFPLLKQLFNIRLDLQVYNLEADDEKLVDLLVLFGDAFPPVHMAGNEAASSGSTSESEVVSKLDPAAIPCGSIYPALETMDEPPGSDSKEISSQESAREKIISVLVQPHEGVPAVSPYSVVPRQTVVPGGGSSDVYISFTPLVLPDAEAELRCDGLMLGFMSLDDKLARMVPNKVQRSHGYEAPPLRVHMEAVLRHPLLFLSTPSTPFSLSSTDPKKSTKTSHSKKEEREEQPQHVLYPQQNMLVKVSFHTTLELLRYQHLPETQLLPGCQVLQLENGERKLKFDQNLVIEHSNCTTQLVPVTAYLTVPALELSCAMVDFQTCFVAQPKTEHVFLYNRDEQKRPKALEVFSIFPTKGILEAREGEAPTREILQISFAPRSDTDYEAIVTISGMLEEKPCKLHLRGRGVHHGQVH